jgi:glycosyltransferase involved in cell wall biosynthesis
MVGKNARNRKEHSNRVTRFGSGVVAPQGNSALARAGRFTSAESLRILWYSNAPFAPTGYGTQTAQVVQRLIKEKHEVAIHAMYGIEGMASMWNGIKLYPRGMSPYSDDVLVAHWMDWANGNRDIPAMLMTLFDVWVLKSPSLDQVPNIASWVPIDHAPCPPEVVSWCKRPNVKPIAMSKFGLDMLQNSGVDAMYAPHAFEKVFVPTPKLVNSRGEFTGRQLMEVDEERFVVTMNAANKGQNPSRKSFGENILAFAIFAQDRPDALLYLHTERDGAMGGINLVHLLEACGVKPEQYKIVDPYAYRTGFPQQALAALYTASDVLLACSMGEGFGIPVIEAQACGTRVIVSNYTAQPELVGAGSGWAVDYQPFWDSHQKSWFCTPSVPSIVEALIASYEAPRGVCKEAVAFASQYDADSVFESHWKPIMKELSEWCRA